MHSNIKADEYSYYMRPITEVYPRTERCAWEQPAYTELLRRGIRWAAGLPHTT